MSDWQGIKPSRFRQRAVNGKLLGSPTVKFLNSSDVAEAFTFTGDFGGSSVAHTATTDRNVYVKSIVFDGVARPELATTLTNNGAVNFRLPATS